MIPTPEPKEAFPYRPPDETLKEKYRHFYDLTGPLKPRLLKTGFDKFFSSVILLSVSPILLGLYIANLIESIGIEFSWTPK